MAASDWLPDGSNESCDWLGAETPPGAAWPLQLHLPPTGGGPLPQTWGPPSDKLAPEGLTLASRHSAHRAVLAEEKAGDLGERDGE